MVDLKHPYNVVPFDKNFTESPVDLSPIQAQINKIFGYEPTTGRPWVRIVWMPSDKTDDIGWPETHDWDEYGDGGRGAWRRRYIYYATRTFLQTYDHDLGIWYAKEVWEDIAPPRFCLEALIPPSSALEGWRASGLDSSGDRFTSRRPDKGMYQPLFIRSQWSKVLAGGMLAIHDGVCCKQAKRDEVNCYGYYVAPDRTHIKELERLEYLKNLEKERRPGFSTTEEFDEAKRKSSQLKEAYWEKLGDKIEGAAYEAARTHRGMLSDDPSVNANGIYHFLGAHNKSGLSKEEYNRIMKKDKNKDKESHESAIIKP